MPHPQDDLRDERHPEPHDEPAPELVARWRAGDQRAATVLYHRYQERLLRLVSHRINSRMRSKLDPDELVQSILKSAFRVTSQEDLGFRDESGFWKWLTTVGLNKTYKKIDALRTAKRDTSREVCGEDVFDERILAEPQPDEVVEVAELLQKILARLTPAQQQILLGKLEGLEQIEIAERLGISSKTVQRSGPVIREAALAVLGADAPDWLFPKDTFRQLWLHTLGEPARDWGVGGDTAGGRTLRAALLDGDATAEELDAIRSQCKRQASEADIKPDEALQAEMYGTLYLLALAAAQHFHGRWLSNDPADKLLARARAMLQSAWLDAPSASALRRYEEFLRRS